MDGELSRLREQVDEIDREIAAALRRRFEVTDEIGRAKRESGAKSVRNAAREREVLDKVGPELSDIYRAIMAAAVRREEQLVSVDTDFGHAFADPALLEEALTTPSYRMTCPEAKDNQRLEFLGDAVLGLMAADLLYAERPNDPEGPLTVRRTHMVSAAALCAAAARGGLAERLRRNRGAAPLPANSKTLADAVEAIIGAAWLDGGLEAARAVFDALNLGDAAAVPEWAGNPKGELQVRAQALTPPRHPVYELVEVAGKSHEPVFTVRVSVEGFGEAVAKAGSRKEAEAAAAASLLANMV